MFSTQPARIGGLAVVEVYHQRNKGCKDVKKSAVEKRKSPRALLYYVIPDSTDQREGAIWDPGLLARYKLFSRTFAESCYLHFVILGAAPGSRVTGTYMFNHFILCSKFL